MLNPGVGQTVTKSYFAAAKLIAIRKYVMPQTMNVEYVMVDHLGSASMASGSDQKR